MSQEKPGRASHNGGSRVNPEPTAEGVGSMLRDNLDSAREHVSRQYHRAEDAVSHNPGSSLLIGFGIGFGLGIVLTSLLSKPHDTWADRHLPDRLKNAPDALHNLADSLRDLPSSISRRLSGHV